MLGPADAIELPDGVRLEGVVLVDDARAARFPANETALFVLGNQRRPLRSVARDLALEHGIEPERAIDDVLRFAHALNAALLANVRASGRLDAFAGRVRLLLCLAPAGLLPPATPRRFAVDTSSRLRSVLSTVRALSCRAFAVTVATVVVLAPGGITLGAFALAAGVGLGIVVHEAGHAVLLRGVCAALVVTGVRTYVIHPPLMPGRRSRVAFAGPAAAALAGAGAVAAGWLAGVPEIALGGCPLAAHAVGLTALTADGRTACTQ